jgi:hypothetical protein
MNIIENLFLTLVILIVGPMLILAGIGYGIGIAYYLLLATPYILIAGGIWIIIKNWRKSFKLNTSIPSEAQEDITPKKPLWSIKHNGIAIPIGVLTITLLFTIIFVPLLLIALFVILPPQVLMILIGIGIISGGIKKIKEI